MTKALKDANLMELERLFLSLADKTRLRLLALMAGEPVSVGFLVDELGESQPKVSRHLAYLRNSGVVTTRRDGKWIYYGVQDSADPDVDRVLKFIIATLSGTIPDITPVAAIPSTTESEALIDEVDYAEDDAVDDSDDYYPVADESEYEAAADEESNFRSESTGDELEVFLL